VLKRLIDQGGVPQDLDELRTRLREDPQNALVGEDDVLDPDEIAVVSQRIRDFNQVLQEAAQLSPRVHLVDVHAALDDAVRQGRQLRGAGPDEWVVPNFTGAPDTQGRDGIFSYDGVHPSDTGHAVLANLILDKLRQDLGSQPRFSRFQNLPPLDEKAVHHADPHAPGAAAVILDERHINHWVNTAQI